jgi:hypothetical protein
MTSSAVSGLARVPKPIAPGPQMAELARFLVDTNWTGTIMQVGWVQEHQKWTAVVSVATRPFEDGRWIVGTYEQDQFLTDRSFVLKWQLHWVAGWDPAASEYRATFADNYGRAGVMRGWIEGDDLTFETLGDEQVRVRLVWDITDPADIVWRNEMSVGGSPWSLVEEYQCRPV